MNHPQTRILTHPYQAGQRILVTSDIHGHPDHLRHVLDAAGFCADDLLVIVGDIVEKGPDSLGTLRYVQELCARGNTTALIGNVDAYRLHMIDTLNADNAEDFYRYLCELRDWCGSSFYEEMARECGYSLSSADDVLAAKDAVTSHFAPELDFLASLPTVLSLGDFVFVHGGLRHEALADNTDCNLFSLTKYDDFANQTPYRFPFHVVVGHWPVALYSDTVQQFNPVFHPEKHIISIDGGCGIKREGQLNLLILPDARCSANEISHIHYDTLRKIRALDAQTESTDSVHINWVHNEIRLISRGEEFSEIEHLYSGKRLSVPTKYLFSDTACRDYTNYCHAVEPGDVLSLYRVTSRGCIVKRNGRMGWYCGAYEELPPA
ncbi:MAG: serine/threonine protein phosphatase [Ruminococcaceae bacterium]|nr:serine/threonine protein phosphatase [Oscillospiraceae bacterium]